MSNILRTDIRETFPLLYGSEDVVEGYFELEKIERNVKLSAYRNHSEAVALWYRALTLYRRGMLGKWDFSQYADHSVELKAAGLQSQLLGLGVSSAKSALDDLLAGYYSLAFAAIRHMVESYIAFLYIAVDPSEYHLWYSDDDGINRKTPRCKRMTDVLKGSEELRKLGFTPEAIDKIYASWSLMAKGSHPTGEGIVQTVDETGARYIVGATYIRTHCLIGFDHGLYALSNLLSCIAVLGGPSQNRVEWNEQRKRLSKDMTDWRTRLRSDLDFQEGI